MIHFIALLAAGACEVAGVLFISKFQSSSGMKKVINLIFLTLNFAVSLWLLSYAMNAIAMSVAYAIWTGIGAIGAVAIGVVFNGEKMSLARAFCLFLIIFSVIMLKII